MQALRGLRLRAFGLRLKGLNTWNEVAGDDETKYLG